MKVTASEAAARTGLAHSGSSILTWFADAAAADGRVDLDFFLTTSEGPLPALPLAVRA